MRIKDFIDNLSKFDPETEIVIDIDGDFVSPKMTEKIVNFKHNYSGMSYKDNAVILTK